MLDHSATKWRFLNTGFHPGAFNMEFDEMLVRSLIDGSGTPAIRVYGWDPPAISLGWNQSTNEIDLKNASSEGIDVVRRPTGGRAILHSEELTYSITMTCPGKSILSVYNEISQALVIGLRELGISISLEKSQPHFPSLYQSPSSAACFSSSAKYEIQFNGKKLVGSAQRRYAGRDGQDIVLQHGSLLLGPDHMRLVHFLNLEINDKKTLTTEFEAKTIDLSSALRRHVMFDEAADAVRIGFEKSWGIQLIPEIIDTSTVLNLS
jgi:lipoate-protein ligase A